MTLLVVLLLFFFRFFLRLFFLRVSGKDRHGAKSEHTSNDCSEQLAHIDFLLVDDHQMRLISSRGV